MHRFHDPELARIAAVAAGIDATMSLGSDSQLVNGQLLSFPTWAAYNPTAYGPQTTGVPQVSPTMPPFIGAANTGAGAGMAAGMEGVGGYGTATNNTLATSVANANPHNLKVSPVWWAVIALVVGLVLLKGVHWRSTTLEGFDERGHAGPVGESASEDVA
jgi:hypothetical protein